MSIFPRQFVIVVFLSLVAVSGQAKNPGRWNAWRMKREIKAMGLVPSEQRKWLGRIAAAQTAIKQGAQVESSANPGYNFYAQRIYLARKIVHQKKEINTVTVPGFMALQARIPTKNKFVTLRALKLDRSMRRRFKKMTVRTERIDGKIELDVVFIGQRRDGTEENVRVQAPLVSEERLASQFSCKNTESKEFNDWLKKAAQSAFK